MNKQNQPRLGDDWREGHTRYNTYHGRFHTEEHGEINVDYTILPLRCLPGILKVVFSFNGDEYRARVNLVDHWEDIRMRESEVKIRHRTQAKTSNQNY